MKIKKYGRPHKILFFRKEKSFDVPKKLRDKFNRKSPERQFEFRIEFKLFRFLGIAG